MPRRPCGPHDRRLLRHRCRPCIQLHIKLQCDELESHGPVQNFMPYKPPPVMVTTQLRVANSTSLDEQYPVLEKSLDAYFTFVGQPSAVTACFTHRALKTFLVEGRPIHTAVSAIVNVLEFRKSRRDLIGNLTNFQVFKLRQSLRTQLSNMLKVDTGGPKQQALLFAMLLCLFELLTEETGVGFFTIMEVITDQIARNLPEIPCVSSADAPLLLFYCMASCYKALILDEAPPIGKVQDLFTHNPACLRECNDVDLHTRLFYQICDFLVLLSKCNARYVVLKFTCFHFQT
ncbi:hypothetical protein BKA67DRAFT_254452 [Truncatella angustata]|uniref:Uncharacterized protein n=1 Tax=Truncatella angustata TaxID=152316 RepID=A0A9P8UQ27_9PEZI|nr:uncharacterized protein BKA67DRAFT_254452 [Truncatella angustata]KAH6656036.1 hypothetical protein BKA67DRAFT_254452 [Truncatella angustata]